MGSDIFLKPLSTCNIPHVLLMITRPAKSTKTHFFFIIVTLFRMMDTGKKRILTLKKADRDRKKLNENILKRLKTLDAEAAGVSIM